LLGISPAALRNWVEREEIGTGARPGTTSNDAVELARLRKENAEPRNPGILTRADRVRERTASGGLADHPHRMMALPATGGSWLGVVGGAHSGRWRDGACRPRYAAEPQPGWR